MALWFFLLGCGGLGFSIKILLEHFKQAEEINDGIRTAERARLDVEEEILAEEAEAAEVKVGNLTAQISKRKEALANRGKFKV